MPWWAILIVVAAFVGGTLGFSGWLLLRQGRVAERATDARRPTHRRPPLRRS